MQTIGHTRQERSWLGMRCAASVLCVASLFTTSMHPSIAYAQPPSEKPPTSPPQTPPTSPPQAQPDEQPDAGPKNAPSPRENRPGVESARFEVRPTILPRRTDLLEPSWVWQTWDLRGAGISPSELEIVRAFIEREIRKYKVLDKDAREHLRTFIRSLGYYLVTVTLDFTDRGPMAVLHLEPGTWVRRVRVDVPLDGVLQLGTLYHVFESEVSRRMSLKPGSRMADDPVAQEKQLTTEAARLENYLKTQGYFEACVEVFCKSNREATRKRTTKCGEVIQEETAYICQGEIELHVQVDKGPLYRLGNIDVIDNEGVDEELVISQFRHNCFLGFCPFSRFNLQTMKGDLEKVVALYKRRGYPAVRVSSTYDPNTSFDRETKQVDFTIMINERRRVDVEFQGERPETLNDEKLRALLTFNDEGSYDDIEVSASADAIRQNLQSRGFFEADVTYHRERLSTVDYILFQIHLGARLRIDSVNFEGNQELSDGALEDVVVSEAGEYASAEQLQADTGRLVGHYRSLGFREVKVRSRVSRSAQDRDNAAVLAALISSSAVSGGLLISFEIEEGPRFLVEEIQFDFICDHVYSERELRKAISVKPGDPLHPRTAERGLSELARFYFSKAHPQAKITASAKDNCEQPPGRLRYCICERDKVRIGKVLIQGNFKTDEWVIRDELNFTEGSELTLKVAEEGPQNLRTTGLFNSVQVNFVDLGKTADDDVNVLVRVQERHDYKASIEVAAGYSTDAGIFGEAGAVAPNIMGQGLRASLRGQLGDQFKTLEGRFTVPRWVMRRMIKIPWLLETNAFWRQEDTERFGLLSSVGAGIGITKLFRKGLFQDILFSLRYDFRQRNRNEPLMRAAGPSEDLEKAPVETRTGAFGATVIIDKRRDARGLPNPLTPDRGFKLEFSASAAANEFLSQDDFLKLGMGGQVFWRPTRHLLVSNSLRYDQGVPFGTVILPEVERFFAGGDTTVRGFEEDRLSTEVIADGLPPYGTIDQIRILPAGGNIRLIHNFDIQLDMWELAGAPVASAVFIDTGLISNSFDGFQIEHLRHSLGVALARWVHPFGSISIEWAIPLDPHIGDNPRGRFHFNFGLLF